MVRSGTLPWHLMAYPECHPPSNPLSECHPVSLDEQLADAVLAENYELAAKLRDRMRKAQPAEAAAESGGGLADQPG